MSKKRILMVSANPWDTKRLRLDQEHDAIQEVLENSSGRDRFDIKVLTAAQDGRFQDQMLKFKPHIVHFSGHGEEGGLAFDSGGEEPHWIGNDTLARFFQTAASHLECVVFNACRTEWLAEAVSEHIDYTIGMNAVINDQAAIHFAQALYRALFEDVFYPKAYKQAILALEMKGLPDQFIPQLKIRDHAARDTFLPGCDPDILILCDEANLEWARGIAAELDDLLSARFGGRNTFTLKLATDSEEDLAGMVKTAGLLLPVLSRQCSESGPCGEALSGFLDAVGKGGIDRVFPLQTDHSPIPEALQAVLPYPFWKTGGEVLAPNEARFNATMEMLVSEITPRVRRLRHDIEYRRKIEAKHLKSSPPLEKLDFPPAILFINSASEDEDLREEITCFLKEHGVEYLEPIDLTDNPTPGEIRRVLELNLEICHLHVLIHGSGRLPWVQEQFLFSQKVWRDLKQSQKIVLIHKEKERGAKGEIKGNLNNVRICPCPPEKYPDYLPKYMREAIDE